MKKQISLPIVLIVAVVVGAGAFFGGMQYQKMQRFGAFQAGGRGGDRMFFNGAGGGQNGARGGGGPNGMNRPIAGEIISSDATGVTVKLQDGSSKIVIVPDSAQINEATSASKQALTQGKKVVIFGTTNSDGSVTAQNIQLNSGNMSMMFGRGGGDGQGR